jgi:hypothetical protein
MAQIKDEILGQNICNLTEAKNSRLQLLRRSFASAPQKLSQLG